MANHENGINGATGAYLFPDHSDKQFAAQARKNTPSNAIELGDRAELRNDSKAPAAWIDPTDLAQAGWGVIFTTDYTPYSLEALKSDNGLGLLLKHRQAQATPYCECTYKPGWNKSDFLNAYEVPSSGAVDPDRGMPYYLMIVGDPATISYEFQYQLDVQYAVGRIHFDTLEEYAYYAQSIIRAETQPSPRPRQIKFWGVSNDEPTTLSSEHLVTPLAEWIAQKHPNWQTPTLLAEAATKPSLSQLLNQEPAPAILFTASHGVGYPKDDPRQRELQGALLCQEWQPAFLEPIDPSTHLFSAADVDSNADLLGMITMNFACYSLGTPQLNNFTDEGGAAELASKPLIAKLPQRLLSHEKGGALAVIGHVERAFIESFQINEIEQVAVFQSFLTCLIKGWPVGYAMEFFNQHYAELAADCIQGIQENNMTDKKTAGLWKASNNARNYAILGDPAVRITAVEVTKDIKDKSRPKVWLEPKDLTDNASPPTNVSDPTPEAATQILDRLTNLEDKTKALQAEIDRLKQTVALLEAKKDASTEI
jgi:Peptidase family C25